MGLRTGAYLSHLYQRQSLWFPNTMICAFAWCRFGFLSGLIARTRIVGIARGAPFSQSALYCATLIVLYVSINFIPYFSSLKLHSQTSWSGCRLAKAVRREWGHLRTRIAALTKFANKSWTKGVLLWPGRRIPLTHRLCLVEIKFRIGTLQSSCFLLVCDL